MRLIISLFVFLILLYLIAKDARASEGVDWYILFLTGMGLVDLGAVLWFRSRPLDTSSPSRLAASYRGSWFIGIGLVQAVALFGFIGVFITGMLWTYVLGMGLSLIGCALIAPTAADLRRRQEQIASQGSTLSLGAALMASGPDRGQP